MTKKNEIQEIVENQSGLPAFMQEDAAIGNECLEEDTDSLSTFVKLLQKTSPEVEEIDELKAGMLYDPAEKKILAEVGKDAEFVTAYRQTVHQVWEGKDLVLKSSDGLRWDESQELIDFDNDPNFSWGYVYNKEKTSADFGKWEKNEDSTIVRASGEDSKKYPPRASTVHHWYGFINGEKVPVIISVKPIKRFDKELRKLIRINNIKHKFPLFGKSYTICTSKCQSSDGTMSWWEYDLKGSTDIDADVYAAAKELYVFLDGSLGQKVRDAKAQQAEAASATDMGME